MGVRLIEEGDKIYLDGKTFDYKDIISQAGGRWDGDRKMWYFGADQMDVARDVVRAIPDPVRPDAEVIGHAVYKERTYPVLWAGETKTGREALKLAFPNGNDSFWVDADKAEFKPFNSPIQWEEYKNMVRPDEQVIGKATYKDRTYSVLHFYETRDGNERMKLAMSNGKTFWVDKNAVSEYQEYKKPITWERLQELNAERRAERDAGDPFVAPPKEQRSRKMSAPGM